MAEAKKPVKPALASAAESSNPAVHALLAQRQTAVLNENMEAVAEIDKKLRDDFGVE